MILTSLLLMLLAFLGTPLFLVISGVAVFGFGSIGRPASDAIGEISRLVQMDTLITIPLFTFTGYMLAESGAPRRLVAVSRALFGWMPGGMAIVTLFTCAFFTTFTGASGITIVAMGGLLLPVLLKQQYPRNFTLGLVTTSGSRGLIFPPSLPVIIYGYVASVDINQLYIAGVVPGLLGLLVIAIWCVRTGLLERVPRTPFDPRAAAKALWQALPEMLLPVWLIALIFTAVLRVPEAAALAALYILLVEVIIYRDIHPIRDLPRITKESMVLCGAVLVILGASLGLTGYLVQEDVAQTLVETIQSSISSKWMFLLALNIFLLIVGCLMDIFSAIVIVVPLIVPLALQYGVDPFHLAIIFLVNLEVGYSTPPVGMNLFIASFRFRQPVVRLYRASLPFLVLALLALAAITYIEPLSTFTLPDKGPTVDPPGTMAPAPGPVPAKAGKAAPETPKEPVFDGICDESTPGDPDCEDIEGLETDESTKTPEPGKDSKATGSAPAAGAPAEPGAGASPKPTPPPAPDDKTP